MNLKARATFGRTMDLREAHLRLLQGGVPIDIEQNTPTTQVWRFMAKLTRSDSGENNWSDRVAAKDYVRRELGRDQLNGKTFLTELSPIPSRKADRIEWMRFFREKDLDLESKLQRRRDDLKHELKTRNPPLIICYGLKRADDFAELLSVEWETISPKIYGSNNGRRFLLPFFGQGQMSKTVIGDLLRFRTRGSASHHA